MREYINSAKEAGYPGNGDENLKTPEELKEHYGRAWEWFNLQK